MISIRKQIEQEEYCFDIAYDEGASLLINSNESNVAGRYRSGSASPDSVSFSAEMLRHGCQDCTYQYPRQSEMV